MAEKNSHTIQFKREVLDWIFEDERKPRSPSAAEKKFKAAGHDVSKKTIHEWITEYYKDKGDEERKMMEQPRRESLEIGLMLEEEELGLNYHYYHNSD